MWFRFFLGGIIYDAAYGLTNFFVQLSGSFSANEAAVLFIFAVPKEFTANANMIKNILNIGILYSQIGFHFRELYIKWVGKVPLNLLS